MCSSNHQVTSVSGMDVYTVLERPQCAPMPAGWSEQVETQVSMINNNMCLCNLHASLCFIYVFSFNIYFLIYPWPRAFACTAKQHSVSVLDCIRFWVRFGSLCDLEIILDGTMAKWY